MARDAPAQSDTLITEKLIRSFWAGYQKLMAFDQARAGEN
jgi:anthranilate 1,2-dioxygenase large subunit